MNFQFTSYILKYMNVFVNETFTFGALGIGASKNEYVLKN